MTEFVRKLPNGRFMAAEDSRKGVEDRRKVMPPSGDFSVAKQPLSSFVVRRPFDRRQKVTPMSMLARQRRSGDRRKTVHVFACPYCDKEMPSGQEPWAWQCCGEVGHAIRLTAHQH